MLGDDCLVAVVEVEDADPDSCDGCHRRRAVEERDEGRSVWLGGEGKDLFVRTNRVFCASWTRQERNQGKTPGLAVCTAPSRPLSSVPSVVDSHGSLSVLGRW
jgi:hypothetical protein